MTALLSLQQAVQLMADYFFPRLLLSFKLRGIFNKRFILFIYLFDALLTEKNISDRYNSPQNRGKKIYKVNFFFLNLQREKKNKIRWKKKFSKLLT